MPYSGMWRRVAQVRTEMVFLRSVRLLLVTANIVHSSPILVPLMMEANTSKRQFLQEPHGVTSQKTVFFIVTAVKTSNLKLKIVYLVGFEVFTTVPITSAVLWDVTPCGSCKNRRFGVSSITILMMEAKRYSRTSVLTQATRPHSPEDDIFHCVPCRDSNSGRRSSSP
jgi:hypothetical protein